MELISNPPSGDGMSDLTVKVLSFRFVASWNGDGRIEIVDVRHQESIILHEI